MHLAITGDEPGIGLVGFGAVQLCPAKGMNLGRVDHADEELLLDQKMGQVTPVDACGFHAEMGSKSIVFSQPIQKLQKSR